MAQRKNWIDVNLDGLRKLLARRGKEFAIYELVSNGWDEETTEVSVELSRPEHGLSTVVVTDDSPEGFRDLAHAYTMFEESYKKSHAEKRGTFNLGEKLVLALCKQALITSTKGQVEFSEGTGRRKLRGKREKGTEFRAVVRLTIEEYDRIVEKVKLLIPPLGVKTTFNGQVIPERMPIKRFEVQLPTVIADVEGMMRPSKRVATVQIYKPLPDEEPTIYEMGIPVVATGDAYHVDVQQKVPLNMERDNVTPHFLKAVRVAVVNAFGNTLDAEIAKENWVNSALEDKRISNEAVKQIITSRFGVNSVAYDPSDHGSNREAQSQDWNVVHGGSMSKAAWANVRNAGVLRPSGQVFQTENLPTKVPDKVYDRAAWTPAMAAYAEFIELVSPALVGYKVTLRFIEDPKMVCGQFFDTYYNVNLAGHRVTSWQENIELMLHELAHTVVKSNDHLNHLFYETVGALGARLALHLLHDKQASELLNTAL